MESTNPSREVDAAAASLRPHLARRPVLAVVLGSGLGDAIASLELRAELPFDAVAGMPRASVAGHRGRFVFGAIGGAEVVVMQGRVHAYEGHGADRVVLGVRALRRLGVERFLLTNASGGIREDLEPGMLMRITDHLNLTGLDPGVGATDGSFGPAFTDLVGAWSAELGATLEASAARAGVALSRGVYAGRLGPSYETPAEIRMMRTLGADAIGMSTVLENLALVQMGAQVAGISCITNRAAGRPGATLDHHDVQARAAGMSRDLGRVVESLVGELAS